MDILSPTTKPERLPITTTEPCKGGSITTSNRPAVLHGPLCYQLLEETYQSCSYGRDEPTEMRMGRATHGRVIDLLAEHFPFDKRNIDSLKHFNQSVLVTDDVLPEDVVLFDGGRYRGYAILERI